MSKRSAEDTIAGYYYQFDKTIFEILNQENEEDTVTVEGIEDIDFEKAETNEKHTIQVKYHAKQEYKLNLVREPIMLMYDDYKNRKTGNKTLIHYTLYIYLKDKWTNLESEYLELTQDKNSHFTFKD